MAISPGGRPADDTPVGTPGGRQNWVDKAGGLPKYVRMVAHALMRKGMAEQHAIAAAVNRIKRWAAGADNVRPQVQAAAAAALAEWEAKKGMALSAHVDASLLLDLSVPDVWLAELRGTFDPAATLDLAREYVRDQVGRFANDSTKNRGADRKAGDEKAVNRNRDVTARDLSSLKGLKALMLDWRRVPFSERDATKARMKSAARRLGGTDRLLALIDGLGDGDAKAEKGEGSAAALRHDAAGAWLRKQGFNLSATDAEAALVLELAAAVGDELDGASLIDLAGDPGATLDLAPGDYHPPYDWKHGYIPITPAAALSKAKKAPYAGKGGRRGAPKGVRVPGKTARGPGGARPKTVAGKGKGSSKRDAEVRGVQDRIEARTGKRPTFAQAEAALSHAERIESDQPSSGKDAFRGKGGKKTPIPSAAASSPEGQARVAAHRKALDDEARGRGVPGEADKARSVLNMPAPTSSDATQRSAVKSNQGPGDSPLSTAQLEEMAKSNRPAIAAAAKRQLEKRKGNVTPIRRDPAQASTAARGDYPKKADGSPDYGAMPATQQHQVRAKLAGRGEGDKVDTDQGPGTVTRVSSRGTTIRLDSGDSINVVNGTPGHDRIKPRKSTPHRTGAGRVGETPTERPNMSDKRPLQNTDVANLKRMAAGDPITAAHAREELDRRKAEGKPTTRDYRSMSDADLEGMKRADRWITLDRDDRDALTAELNRRKGSGDTDVAAFKSKLEGESLDQLHRRLDANVRLRGQSSMGPNERKMLDRQDALINAELGRRQGGGSPKGGAADSGSPKTAEQIRREAIDGRVERDRQAAADTAQRRADTARRGQERRERLANREAAGATDTGKARRLAADRVLLDGQQYERVVGPNGGYTWRGKGNADVKDMDTRRKLDDAAPLSGSAVAAARIENNRKTEAEGGPSSTPPTRTERAMFPQGQKVAYNGRPSDGTGVVVGRRVDSQGTVLEVKDDKDGKTYEWAPDQVKPHDTGDRQAEILGGLREREARRAEVVRRGLASESGARTKSDDELRKLLKDAAPAPSTSSTNPDAPIRIEHTPDGTLVHGTTREDAADIKAVGGFKWSRNLNAWYLPRTWRPETRENKVRQLEAKLGDKAGVDKTTGPRKSAAEREADTRARAGERAERMDARADKRSAEAERRFEASDLREEKSGIPFGQPILVGHHSERRHRRALDRAHANMGKGVEAQREAESARASADRARRTAAGTESKVTIGNRIAKNEREVRDLERRLAGTHSSSRRKPEGEYRQRLERMLAEAQDQLQHDQGKMAAAGGVPSKDSVSPGDFVKIRGQWYPVRKSNAKTVGVPNTYGDRTRTAPWHEVSEHRKAGDVTRADVADMVRDTSQAFPNLKTALAKAAPETDPTPNASAAPRGPSLQNDGNTLAMLATPGGVTPDAARRMSDDQLERTMQRLMASGDYDGPAFGVIETELNRRDNDRPPKVGDQVTVTGTGPGGQGTREVTGRVVGVMSDGAVRVEYENARGEKRTTTSPAAAVRPAGKGPRR